MSHNGVADHLGDHDADPRRGRVRSVDIPSMDRQQCCACAATAHTGTPAAPNDVSEVPWKRQAVAAGQHRVSTILSDGS